MRTTVLRHPALVPLEDVPFSDEKVTQTAGRRHHPFRGRTHHKPLPDLRQTHDVENLPMRGSMPCWARNRSANKRVPEPTSRIRMVCLAISRGEIERCLARG
jgi:hypothetical protein